jgi:hypothetical protein
MTDKNRNAITGEKLMISVFHSWLQPSTDERLQTILLA